MNRQRETLLNVAGMTCMSCVRHVDQALRDVEGVSAIDVRLREGKVLVTHDARAVPTHALIEALRDAGYEGTASP